MNQRLPTQSYSIPKTDHRVEKLILDKLHSIYLTDSPNGNGLQLHQSCQFCAATDHPKWYKRNKIELKQSISFAVVAHGRKIFAVCFALNAS